MPPLKHRLALVGFGTVAQGLCQILYSRRADLLKEHAFDFDIVAVTSPSRGSMYDPEGLSLSKLVELGTSRAPFTDHLQTWDSEAVIRNSNATIVIELTPTDLKTAEPALTYCQAAFESGKHIITGNKGPAALNYQNTKSLAEQSGLAFLNEATVLSGTPVISLFQQSLAGIRIHGIRGILNGTTNFILSEMESGARYEQALETAENRGYLEADKTADIEGFDAQAKLVILANILMDIPLRLQDVQRSGISSITSAKIQAAKQADKRWKLVASLTMDGDQVLASVQPEQLPLSDPLSHIMDTGNALTFSTDLLGDVTISGPGAGSIETGYSILSDLLTINRGNSV